MKAAFGFDGPLLPEIFPRDLYARLSRAVTFGDPPEVLITGWGAARIDAAALHRLPRLRAVVHAAGSVKHLVAPEVFERGVLVSSAAAANAVPVADYTMAMLTLAAKDVPRRISGYAAGSWPVAATPGVPGPGERGGLAQAVIGVVGASRVGRIVISRLLQAGASVLLHDPYTGVGGCVSVSLDELCRQSDIVTVHAPELPETRGMFGARQLALMRDGAVLINTARGSLVDTAALTAECGAGRIGAILDVTEPEPLPPGHPLLTAPGVWVTPHISGARGGELRRLGEFAVAEVERLARGEPLLGRVRGDELPRMA